MVNTGQVAKHARHGVVGHGGSRLGGWLSGGEELFQVPGAVQAEASARGLVEGGAELGEGEQGAAGCGGGVGVFALEEVAPVGADAGAQADEVVEVQVVVVAVDEIDVVAGGDGTVGLFPEVAVSRDPVGTAASGGAGAAAFVELDGPVVAVAAPGAEFAGIGGQVGGGPGFTGAGIGVGDEGRAVGSR